MMIIREDVYQWNIRGVAECSLRRSKMRKNGMYKKAITTATMMLTGFIALVGPRMTVSAHTIIANIQGTVSKGTTSDTLYLYSPSSGNYTIKIDSDTDTSKCRLLVPGKAVTVAIYRGDDAVLHAENIVGGKANNSVTVDANRTTVSGVVKDNSTEEMIYLDTTGGEMQIKIDPTTDFTGTKLMVAGKTITVVCSRGSDAYMHAVSISDNSTTQSSTAAVSTSSTPENTIAVTGYPTESSTSNMLYLDTSGGVMSIKVDDTSDTNGGFMFIPGNKLTVYVYRGSDAYMHAAKIVGTRSSSTVSGASTTTFTGNVYSDSTDSTMYLGTSGGTMHIKLDAGTTVIGAKGIVKGRTVTVAASVGSDGYWHAVTVTAK